MKNLSILLAAFFVIGISTSSCKKNWTCECSTENGSDSVSYNLEALRKNDARTLCNEYTDVWHACQVKEIK